MVKIVSSLAAQLAAAEKRIEDLEKKNETLEKKNEALSRENKLLRASSTRLTPISPPPSPRESLAGTPSPSPSTPSRSEARYYSPTQASINRAAEIRTAKRRTAVSLRCKELHVGTATYVYTDGRLTKVNEDLFLDVPGFMKPTDSSTAKQCGSGWRHRSTSNWDMSVSLQDSTTVSEDTTPTEETMPSEDTTPFEEAEEPEGTPKDPSQYNIYDLEQLVGQPIDGLFPGETAHINSKVGHGILRAAHEIAQEAFFEASRKFWPEVWNRVLLGPHTVKLGKLEIDSYVGSLAERVDLSLCGSKSSTVHECLMGLIDLRNTMSHPNGYSFEKVNRVDYLLRRVQRFTLALRDDERTTRVRSLRDKLHQLAEEAFDQITHFSPLAVLPFANEEDETDETNKTDETNETNPQWESHHICIFTFVLHYHITGWWQHAGGEFEGPCPDQYRSILDVAMVWAKANSPELLLKSGFR